MSWNIQGLPPQKLENKEFGEFWYQIILAQLCLQETWTNNDSKIEMNNYVMYQTPDRLYIKRPNVIVDE